MSIEPNGTCCKGRRMGSPISEQFIQLGNHFCLVLGGMMSGICTLSPSLPTSWGQQSILSLGMGEKVFNLSPFCISSWLQLLESDICFASSLYSVQTLCRNKNKHLIIYLHFSPPLCSSVLNFSLVWPDLMLIYLPDDKFHPLRHYTKERVRIPKCNDTTILSLHFCLCFCLFWFSLKSVCIVDFTMITQVCRNRTSVYCWDYSCFTGR